MVDLAPELKDFVESAAAMTNLDLIITIDTASAHLAGAMGRPAFVMLPFSPDWRWLNGESDSCLWYSTSRLFRQPARDDWTPVVERVTQALEEFVAHRA
jgi:ADP-heptose:LPS heptosyltransferase